jgi:hypothetical protein
MPSLYFWRLGHVGVAYFRTLALAKPDAGNSTQQVAAHEISVFDGRKAADMILNGIGTALLKFDRFSNIYNLVLAAKITLPHIGHHPFQTHCSA